MLDFIDGHDGQMPPRQGMLFLFDVVNSTEKASKSDNITNSIFYQKIAIIAKSVVDDLNSVC